jgi:hypothetical protein
VDKRNNRYHFRLTDFEIVLVDMNEKVQNFERELRIIPVDKKIVVDVS